MPPKRKIVLKPKKKLTKLQQAIKEANSVTKPKYKLSKNATWEDVREHNKWILGDE